MRLRSTFTLSAALLLCVGLAPVSVSAGPLSISQDVSDVETAKKGARGKKVTFKPFTLAEVQKLADSGIKGSRGAKSQKLSGNFQVQVGPAGSRGKGSKVKLADMIKNVNAYGQRLAKLGINLRTLKNGDVVEKVKHDRKALQQAVKRAKAALKKNKPVVRNLPRWFQKFGKKKGARGAKADNPYQVNANHKLVKSGARGASGSKSKFEWKKSAYPIDFGKKKWVKAKAGAEVRVTATAKTIELFGHAEVSGAALNKSYDLVKTTVTISGNSNTNKTKFTTKVRWLNKDVKVPAWMNKTHNSKYEVEKTWEKSVEKSDSGSFDFGLCKGTYGYGYAGKIGVKAALALRTVSVSARLIPFASLKLKGKANASSCVGNKVGGEGQITVVDASFTLGGDAGLAEDNKGLHVHASAFGLYEYTVLKGYIGGWAEGWITDPWTAFTNLFRKKKKKLKKVKKELWRGDGYTGRGYAFKLDAGKHYLTGSNNQVSQGGGTSPTVNENAPNIDVKRFGAPIGVKMVNSKKGKSAIWIFEPAGKGFVRLKNAQNGKYLHIEKGRLELGNIQKKWWSAMWKVTKTKAKGFKRIQNRWKNDRYLHIEYGQPEVTKLGDMAWWSAMWKLEMRGPLRYAFKSRWKKTYIHSGLAAKPKLKRPKLKKKPRVIVKPKRNRAKVRIKGMACIKACNKKRGAQRRACKRACRNKK